MKSRSQVGRSGHEASECLSECWRGVNRKRGISSRFWDMILLA